MEKSIDVLKKLASAIGRRDEIPNVELAKSIVKNFDVDAVKVLVDNLKTGNKAIQNDCIKVLYEIGTLKPQMISDYLDEFLFQLKSKNNRLQWGAMSAISSIVIVKSREVYNFLPQLIDAANSGSVITRDQMINILIHLGGQSQYQENVIPLVLEQLMTSPVTQLPMYAERASPIVDEKHQERFVSILKSRLKEIDKQSRISRITRVINKVSKT